MARKSFHTSTATKPIEFDIDGEVFHCNGEMAAGVLMRFADMAIGDEDEDDPQRGRAALAVVRDFFKAALTTKDRKRFFDLLEDPDRNVNINMLISIANWLGQEYTARPTGTPSSASSSETDSGVDSTDGVVPGVTTFSRKETPAAV
jgi:hypothetical protein